jgi:uncharacterized protein YdcH (DUF465 family)
LGKFSFPSRQLSPLKLGFFAFARQKDCRAPADKCRFFQIFPTVDKYSFLPLKYHGNLEKLRVRKKVGKMERQDLELIDCWIDQDQELKRYVEEHEEFERRLEEFNRRPYLTTAETIEKKRLQKLKLAGRDKIEQILAKYREKETTT